MRIAVVSRSWPSNERSGVSLAAETHVRMLLDLGHEVSIVGAFPQVVHQDISGVLHRICVPASGSGALYSKAIVDTHALQQAFLLIKPDLIMLEAWQTALTDAAVEMAAELRIPSLMVSHGVSLFPHKHDSMQYARSICWSHYRLFKLPKLLQKLTAITCLDEYSSSSRFFDRVLANKIGLKIFLLKNLPVHYKNYFVDREHRKKQILLVGYFSAIKNQIQAIHAFKRLALPIELKFIGVRSGKYYEACKNLANKLNLQNSISFLQDNECNLAEEIAGSAVVYAPSITEALPIALIEAMACGTPFVASAVGAIPGLRGGIAVNGLSFQVEALKNLIEDVDAWNGYSLLGRDQYQQEYCYHQIKAKLEEAVKYCVSTQ